MTRPTWKLTLAVAIVFLSPLLLMAQDGQRTTHQAKTASVPAPASLPPSMESGLPVDPEAADLWEAALSSHHRPGPLGEATDAELAMAIPQPPLNTPVTGTIPVLENRALPDSATNDVTSTVLEPSVAVRGAEVLYTSNWFASFSTDGGATFTYVNPVSSFPTIPGQRFCCDQVAIYDATNDLMIWFLQYEDDGSQNTMRIAVAAGADIANQQWRFYDFTPQGVGGWTNEWFDYPDLALGDDFLYITTNTFSTTGSQDFTRAVILRLPLVVMANNQALTFDFFDSSQDFSLRPTQGATDTMYFANHITSARLRVYEWPESGTALTSAEIAVQPWSRAPKAGAGPDGPWLGRSDPRITAAWLSGDTAGFAWSAAQDGSFAQPHVRAALIDTATMTLGGQPHLWNDDFAYAYPAASHNGNGEIGISVSFGGGVHHPSHAVGTFTAPDVWNLVTTVAGTNSPTGDRWGDYLTVRPDPNDGAAWFATGYSLQGGRARTDIEPRLIRFAGSGVTPPPQISLENLSPNTTLKSGGTTTIRATLTQGGAPLANQQVTFSDSPPNLVTLSPVSATTNASGVAETTATAVSGADGTATVTATTGGASGSATVEVPDLSMIAMLVLLALLIGAVAASRRREGRESR